MAAERMILELTRELQLPQSPPAQEPCSICIYRVPKILTDVNSQAYQPKIASFGPYHHNCCHLRPMEKSKHSALLQFHRRIAKASKSPNDVLIAMRRVEARLIAYYNDFQVEEEEENVLKRGRFRTGDMFMEMDEFLKIMIVDGCFALEIMLAFKRYVAEEQSEYDSHEPVFGAERMIHVVPYLKRDMLLLENQLPLLALTTLAAIDDASEIGDVTTLIKAFYNLSSVSPKDGIIGECFHILDLYRKILTYEGEYLPSYENIQSATKLRNVGVSFCKSKTNSFRDISFNGGILYLPQLKVDNNTESSLLNLMAFQNLHAIVGNEVTVYVFFMNGLIKIANDVALLRSEKIIKGFVSNENIFNMFNNIIKKVIPTIYQEEIRVDVAKKLNNYYKNRMHWWRACIC